MPWTTPITWSNSAVVGQSELNEQIRDNMNFLFAPPFAHIVTAHTAATRISATSTTAVPLTAGMSAALTTYGGDLNVFFLARKTGLGTAVFNLEYNGTAVTTHASGLATGYTTQEVWYNAWITGLASGAHVFVPTWESLGGATMQLDCSGYELTFWVREG